MAGEFLCNLPSRGFFTSPAIPPTTSDNMKIYICQHDTSPPVDQVIRTDPTNILIRSLTLKKAKADTKLKESKRKAAPENDKGKRPAERPADDRPTTKRANTSSMAAVSENSASMESTLEKDLLSCTVDKLRGLLKEKGLPTKGKKDELIARLRK